MKKHLVLILMSVFLWSSAFAFEMGGTVGGGADGTVLYNDNGVYSSIDDFIYDDERMRSNLPVVATPIISKGEAIVNAGFAGTVSSSGTTITFTEAADAILAGYHATYPALGTTIIASGDTVYIQSWADSTHCTVDTAPSPAWSADSITSVHGPIALLTDSGGVIRGYMDAAGILRALGNVVVGGTATIDDFDSTGNITFNRNGNLRMLLSSSTVQLARNTIPSGDNIYDLGTGSYAWKDFYMSGNALIGTTLQDTVTAATSNGTTTITKAGENFVTSCAVGDVVIISDATTAADEGVYTIVTVTSDTALVLDSALAGSDADVDFTVRRNGVVMSDTRSNFDGTMTVSADTDVTTTLGRGALGSPASDIAHFAHVDNLTSGNYAIRQSAAGATAVNSKTGQSLFFRRANAGVGMFDSSGNFLIGTTDTDGTPAIGRLIAKGSTNDGSTNIFVGRDSDEANVFTLDTDGNIATSSMALSTPTYNTITDWFNTTQSAGVISGGTFTDNGDGTLKVAAGTGIVKTTNSAVGVNKFFDWAENADVKTSVGGALTDEATNYIYVDYNSGTPVIYSETTKTGNGRTKFYLGKLFREGSVLHMAEAGQGISEQLKRLQSRITGVDGEIVRASGLVIGETGNRYVTMTEGVLYGGSTRMAASAVDTSGADTYELYYRDGGVGWTESSASQLSNTLYDDGDGTPGTLTSNRYGLYWIYVCNDGDLLVVMGQGDYTLALAEAENPPSSIPNHAGDFAFLAAKLFIKESGTNFYANESAYDTAFTPSGAAIHNELSGLDDGDYHHLTAAEYAALGSVELGGLYGINVETLAANDSLVPDTDKIFQRLDPGGANRDVVLDTASASAGDRFVIRNIDDYDQSYYLIIKQSATVLSNIYCGAAMDFMFDGTNWKAMGIGGADSSSNETGRNLSVGRSANGSNYGTALGNSARGDEFGVGVGQTANGSDYGVAVGLQSDGAGHGTAVGYDADTTNDMYSIALGFNARTSRQSELSINIDGSSGPDYLHGVLGWAGSTANATPAEIFLSNDSNVRATIAAESSVTFSIMVIARDSTADESAGYKVEGVIHRDGSGNTEIVGGVTKTVLAEDDVSWDVAVTADDTNEALVITVTGDASNTVNWTASGRYVEYK